MNAIVYFERISIWNFLVAGIRHQEVRLFYNENRLKIYYVDASYLIKKIILPYVTFIHQLDFKMMDIKDENGELIRLRIPRVDLFQIQDGIKNSFVFKLLAHKSWQQNRILAYLEKGLIDVGIVNQYSAGRMLYIIQVLKWHMNKNEFQCSIFIINKRPWIDIYKKYASKYNIKIISANNLKLVPNKTDLQAFIRNNTSIYGLVKNIKYKRFTDLHINVLNCKSILYVDGRGDINLSNDGYHSDFFWHLNSKFPGKKILNKYFSEIEKNYLINNGLLAVSDGVVFNDKGRDYQKPTVNYNSLYIDEYKNIKSLLSSYDLDRYYWSAFFKKHDVKIYFTWYRYSNDHLAIADAIEDNDGISALWQIAFDGYQSASCYVNLDICFCFSKFSYEIDKKLNSKIKYSVITGYPKDYAASLLKEKALIVRKKLQDNGAKKIVFVIDENSNDDSRWHTGHELQRENYSYILEKMLETPWLGVIFKPKTAKTLRHRLGHVYKLLEKAKKTGRCYIYDASGRHTTSAPPIVAGLSSDICIHTDLSSGTAALECALENIPTLLIDREGCPSSILNKLPNGKVVFTNWTETIDAVMEHFSLSDGIPGFGDWSSIINDLDPYRDGKAANRIGTYLDDLIQGFDAGLNKEQVMENAAEKYRNTWGNDMVLTA